MGKRYHRCTEDRRDLVDNTVEFSKLDAALSSALSESPDNGRRFTVFISFTSPLSGFDVDELRGHGVRNATADRTILTATLPRQIIGELSELPRVRSIRLSGTSKMLGLS